VEILLALLAIVVVLINVAGVISIVFWFVRLIIRAIKNEPELITIKDDLLLETPEDKLPEILEEQW